MAPAAARDAAAAQVQLPWGVLRFVVDARGRLTWLGFVSDRPTPAGRWRADERLRPAGEALLAYAEGEDRLAALPLVLEGTPFTCAVWEATRAVAFGTTISYGALAILAGAPGAARAVGRAMAACHLAPVIPCHRVIAAGGKLGGYGDLRLKQVLLTHEGAWPLRSIRDKRGLASAA